MTRSRSRVVSLGFAVFLALVVLGGVFVGNAAESAILDSSAGQVSTFSLDPNSPGFRAFTTSTETALVLHTSVNPGVGAELVGATLLAAADNDAGGTVVTIPRTFVDPRSSGVSLSRLFEADGLDAVVDELNESLGIGFGEVVVLDAASWTGLMVADLPLTLTLRDDLVTLVNQADPDAATDLLLAAGTRDFALAEIARIAGHRNPGEPALGVALRQQQVWQAWISRTAGTEERPDLFQQSTGFARLIGALANAEVSYRVIDTVTRAASNPQNTTYDANSELIADLISRIVPFPDAVGPGDRPTVLLLDTSLGALDPLPVASAVARSGGVVSILGNSEAETGLEFEVQVHDSNAMSVAVEIADRLGYPAPRMVPLLDSTTALTVIAG